MKPEIDKKSMAEFMFQLRKRVQAASKVISNNLCDEIKVESTKLYNTAEPLTEYFKAKGNINLVAKSVEKGPTINPKQDTYEQSVGINKDASLPQVVQEAEEQQDSGIHVWQHLFSKRKELFDRARRNMKDEI